MVDLAFGGDCCLDLLKDFGKIFFCLKGRQIGAGIAKSPDLLMI